MNNWLNSENVSDELKKIIREFDEKDKKRAFSKQIDFGTAGMRGTMGAGPGFINENMINWATIGYAKYLLNKFDNPFVVIAYDNRYNSDYFARIAANVLTNFKIKVGIFSELKSTPQLSFTIRNLNASGGINITASHNPKSDNGYKLYDETGCQYLPGEIDEIKSFINVISPIDHSVYYESNPDYLIELDSDEDFVNFVSSIINSKFENYDKILYTALYGCGSTIVPKINDVLKFKNIYYVDKQMKPDSSFETAPSPNPDTKSTYGYAIDSNVNNCSYIVSTDPDADRVGVYDAKNDILFNGNQLATLLLNYMLETKQYKEDQMIISSNVSSMLPTVIARKYGIESKVVLTGFKWIGNIIDEESFLFAFEESNGYLIHTKTRDKDGISATFKVFEMINYYFNLGINLKEKLDAIYDEFGYYLEDQVSIIVDDLSQVEEVFKQINLNTFENIHSIDDYSISKTYSESVEHEIDFPKANMIKINFNSGDAFAIRPSGTEPKIKIYFFARGNSKDESISKLNNLKELAESLFK